MSKKPIYVTLAVLAAISLVGSFMLGRYSVGEPTVITTSDTTIVVDVDSIFVPAPVMDYEVVLEEVYIEVFDGDTIILPVTQRYYSSPYYQIWISGYKPRLDSVNVFSRTERITISNTSTVVENSPKRWSMSANAGLWKLGNGLMPYVGLSVSPASKWSVGVNVGLMDKEITYGLNLGYKIF